MTFKFDPKIEFEFDLKIERESQTWRALIRRAEKRLAEYRLRNDAHSPPEQTAYLRGRIAELKDFLALDKAPDKPVDED